MAERVGLKDQVRVLRSGMFVGKERRSKGEVVPVPEFDHPKTVEHLISTGALELVREAEAEAPAEPPVESPAKKGGK